MTSPRPVFLLPWAAVVLLSSPACINVPDIEPAKAEVRITSPEALAYTNGVLEVRLAVTGHTPERVELLQDGEVLAEVAAPYTYAWDTAGVAEGTHQLVARAVFGDVVFASEAREVVVDRTPPQVVSRTPEPGAQDVWVKSPIQAVFSEPVKASTVTDASVRLTVGTVEVARTVSLSADGRTVTVVPGDGYAPSNPVTLEFLPQTTDLAGNSVTPFAEPWNWLVPYWIPWGSANGAITRSHSDRVEKYVHDSSGNLTALWRIASNNSFSIFIKRFENGEWKTYGNALTAAPNEWDIPSKALVLDNESNPIVAWSRAVNPDTYQISARRWTNGQWVSLGNGPGISADFPKKQHLDLQMSPHGRPTIAWSESDSTTTRICTSEWDASKWAAIGSCVDAKAQYADDYWVTNPELRFSPSGVPTVSWFGNRDNSSQLFVSQFIDSVWTFLESDHDTDLSNTPVSMTFGSTGLPALAWTFPTGGGGYFLVTVRWNGSEWRIMGTFPPYPSRTISPSAFHSLQSDSTGATFIAWSDNRVHVQRWDGKSWQPLDDASNSGTNGYTTHESLQNTPSGELVLTWFQNEDFETRMHARRLNR